MGSALTLVLIIAMAFLVLKGFNAPGASGEARTFNALRLLAYQAAEEIARGELVTLLDEFAVPALPLHIVHRSGPQSPAKVRAFIDLLAEHLRAQAWLLQAESGSADK